MNKVTTLAVSTMVALTLAITSSTSAFAGKRERKIAAGIIIGAIGGAIIAGAIHKHHKKKKYKKHYRHKRVYRAKQHRYVRHHSRLSRWERHVIRCQRRYRSYDEYSDTYITHSGRERRCRL